MSISKLKGGMSFQDITKVFKRNRVATVIEVNKTIDEINEEFENFPVSTLQAITEAGNITTLNLQAQSFTNSNGLVKPYKSYVVVLVKDNTTSNNVVVVAKENSVGAVVWSRLSIGGYRATLTGAFPNGNGQTILFPSFVRKQVGTECFFDMKVGDGNYIDLQVFASDGTTHVDGFTGNVEFRVYPS